MRQDSSDASNAGSPGGSTASRGDRARRLPARERRVDEITAQDYRVRVTGTIVDVDEKGETGLLDDGTGRALLLFADQEQLNKAAEVKLVRVIGRASGDNEVRIEVEIIQDMSGLDLELYKRLRYLEEKERCSHV